MSVCMGRGGDEWANITAMGSADLIRANSRFFNTSLNAWIFWKLKNRSVRDNSWNWILAQFPRIVDIVHSAYRFNGTPVSTCSYDQISELPVLESSQLAIGR